MSKSGIFYTTEQAEGAFPNGTRIEKIQSDETDSHRNGAKGKVIGSMGNKSTSITISTKYGSRISNYIYFVEWDDTPDIPVAIAGFRLKEVKEDI
jgi:hypothetical protein